MRVIKNGFLRKWGSTDARAPLPCFSVNYSRYDYDEVASMDQTYVEQRNGGYWVSGTRVSLDSIVYRFLEGLSPEGIADCFPSVTLEQVYGAITYYLAHRVEIDRYLCAVDAEYELFRQRVRTQYPRLSRKLDALLPPTQPRPYS